MVEGLLRINLADLEEEEEDEDYIPQAKEIEEYKRERKEEQGSKKKQNPEERKQELKKLWIEAKLEIEQQAKQKERDTNKSTKSLLLNENQLLQLAQKALKLNEEDKRRKVFFAGQEFVVDSSGEIVGRADAQPHLKEFQLFDSNDISKKPLPDPSKKIIEKEEEKEVIQELKEEIITEKPIESEKLEMECEGIVQIKQEEEIQEQIKIETLIVEQQTGVIEVEEQIKQENIEHKNEENTVSLSTKEKQDFKNRFEYLKMVMEKITIKQKSITSIHKSKLDWKSFTKKEKLEKKFEQNRKAGYLEKQSFIAKAQEKQKQIQKNSRR